MARCAIAAPSAGLSASVDMIRDTLVEVPLLRRIVRNVAVTITGGDHLAKVAILPLAECLAFAHAGVEPAGP